jgi:hypothetical protein
MTKTRINKRAKAEPKRKTLNPRTSPLRTKIPRLRKMRRNPPSLRKTGATKKTKEIPTWLAKTRSPRRRKRRLDRSHRVARARVLQRNLKRTFPTSPESRNCGLILRRHQLLVLASLKVSFITLQLFIAFRKKHSH